jgi:hypothetical protein
MMYGTSKIRQRTRKRKAPALVRRPGANPMCLETNGIALLVLINRSSSFTKTVPDKRKNVGKL